MPVCATLVSQDDTVKSLSHAAAMTPAILAYSVPRITILYLVALVHQVSKETGKIAKVVILFFTF